MRKGGLYVKTDWQKLASIGICITLAFLAIFLLGKYMIAIFLPFIIAWIMACLTNAISNGIRTKIKIPKRLCAVAVLILLFVAVGWLLFFGANKFFTEIENFIGRLTSEGGSLSQRLSEIAQVFNDLGSHIPLVNELKNNEQFLLGGEKIDEVLISFLKGLAADLGTALTSFATAAVKALPSIALFVIISIIASFYFAIDFETINDWILRVLPKSLRRKVPRIKAHTKSLAARYLKAYSILMALTFFELYIGLGIMGVDYSFLLALGISFLDALPIFGVGTVLIPWAVLSFITHDFALGFGLVILWALVSVIRQIIEPRIIGGTIGLHPIVTLIGMYVGFRLFSIVGMFLAPAVIIAARTYFGKKVIESPISAIDSEQKK